MNTSLHHALQRRSVLTGALAATPALLTVARALAQDAEGDAKRPREHGAASLAHYDLAPGLCYLNHASIGTIPTSVRRAHARYAEVCESNPWLHVWGGVWSEMLDDVHAQAAALLNVAPARVALVQNTTAAFGLAAAGLPIGKGDEVLFSSLNHVGASASWEFASTHRGFRVRRFAFPEADVASLSSEAVVEAHVRELRDETSVLVLPHIDNVYGIRHDIAAIATAARARGVRWILVDAAQSVGMVPVDVASMGADLVATSAHKWLQAPKGSGVMAVSDAVVESMQPSVASWGQKRWGASAAKFTDVGTRDLPKLLAIGDALALHRGTAEGRDEHHRAVRDALRGRCLAEAGLEWRSPASFDAGGAVGCIGLRDGSARDAARRLFEEHQVVVRGFEGDGRNHIRVSPGVCNGPLDIDRFFRALRAVI